MKTRLTKRERLTRRRMNHQAAAFRHRLQRDTWKRKAKRLQAENERLRQDCAEAYQVIGAMGLNDECGYTEADVARALDNLSAAANGQQRPHDDLLPWPAHNRY